jgi:hypothetical protein
MGKNISDIIAAVCEAMPAAGMPAEPPKINFPIPKKFMLPDGLNAGDLFNAVGTFRINEAGLMEIIQVDGCPINPDMTIEESEGDPNPAAPGAMGQTGYTNQVTGGSSQTYRSKNPLNFKWANRAHRHI